MGKKNVSSSMTVQDLMRLFTGILNGFRKMKSGFMFLATDGRKLSNQ